ncbi:MAG: hypothetical protein WCS37_00350 [Chloroflexota bacterium]|nr:hypothetical protein [Chloroflexota bacterium]
MSHEFNWSEYLYFAQSMVGNFTNPCSEEAKLRAAISRAYYAAYWKARKYIEDDTSYTPSSGYYKHQEVKGYFYQRRSHPLYNLIYLKLMCLYDLRILADYKDSQAVTIKDTQLALNYASEIIKQVSRLK